MTIPDSVEWLAPWHSVADDLIQIAGMKLELRRELSAGHPLYGLPVRTLARRQDCDDVLFAVEDGSGRVAVVHLTWTSKPEEPPCPWTVVYANFEEWAAVGMRVDNDEFRALAPEQPNEEHGTFPDEDKPPSFIVYKTSMLEFVPVGRLYYCVRCEQDLSEWVMKQPPGEPSACPNCHYPVQGEHIAQAQRETKIGCLLSLVAFASLFLIPAALVAVTVLLSRP